ncbi:Aromatic-ring hydroxylase-like protein [Artemisia annua]|uniref:Aromatic-ring hydroxylase-like protein n=1 Tax=Artemisia annua TaxID=35608 RepID=A0A2U1PSJ8_ARTAN|nr:Aromatic-ring hydroxylase-like protein [Artemisia annua]
MKTALDRYNFERDDWTSLCDFQTALKRQRAPQHLHFTEKGSTVFERSESLRNITGSAIGIRQNGWRALDRLGVADILRHTAALVKRDGETRCLRRKDLIDTLFDALPTTTVKFGCQLEFIKIDPNTNKPVLRFIDGSSIIPKVVIGCDGGKSIVADFLNLKPPKMFPLCGVRGLTNYPNGHFFDYEFARFKKGNNLVGRIPINDKLVYWFCAQPYVPRDGRMWEDPEVIRRSCLDLLGDYPQEIKEMIEKADVESLSFSRLRYRTSWDLLTGTFCKGTVIVAGDAMHIMGPFLGQGGSAGLEDDIALARNMAKYGFKHIESGKKVAVHGIEEAFNLFVKERRIKVDRLSLQTYLTGMLFGASSWLKKVICIALLSVLFRNRNGHIDYDCGDL